MNFLRIFLLIFWVIACCIQMLFFELFDSLFYLSNPFFFDVRFKLMIGLSIVLKLV